MKTHSSEKIHKCKYCDKTFSDSSNLNRHKKTQSKEKVITESIVIKPFQILVTLLDIYRHILGRAPLSTKIVAKHMQGKNRIINNADFVARSLQRLLIFQDTCLNILEKILISVVYVIKLLQGKTSLKTY